MDKGKLFAVFVALIMVVSTLGFALMRDNGEEQTPADNLPPEQPLTEMKFKAENVPAKVVEILQSVYVQGYTKEFNIDKIDSSIYGIKGVKRIQQSVFSQTQGGLVYEATVFFEKDYNAGYIVGSIEQKGILESVYGNSIALVELPKKIVFKSENDALGISKDYEFSDSMSNALAGIQTLKGDELKVKVSAVFLGAKLSEIFSNETENITAKPSTGSLSLELPLQSLEKKLSFAAMAFFSALPDKNSLEQKLSQLPDVNSVKVSVPSIAPKVLVSKASAISEENLHDLNVFVQSLNPQRADFLNSESFSASIVFDADANLLDARQKIFAELDSMGISDANIEESSGQVFGEISLTQEDSKNAGNALQSLLESNSMAEIQVLQTASLKIDSVFDSNSNATYPVDSNSVQAYLKPGHSVGDKINATVTYYLVRKKIDFIMAEEKD